MLFMTMMGTIELNIILTRNPSFWWHFSKTAAPRPSLTLLLPVIAILIGALFMSVYWNGNIKPDGDRYVFEGAGALLDPLACCRVCCADV